MSRARSGFRQPLNWVIALLLPVGLLLIFAGFGSRLPLFAASCVALDPMTARSRGADLSVDAGSLVVTERGKQGRVEVFWLLPDEVAGLESPILRLRIEGGSVLHAGRVLLQRGEKRDTLLFPGWLRGDTVLGLAPGETLDRSSRLGLILTPPDLLPVPAAEPVNLRIAQACIESASVASGVEGLMQFWFGHRPWNGRSNHTSGFEHGANPPPGFQALVAAWLCSALLLLAVFRRGQWTRSATCVCVASILVMSAEATWQHLQRAQSAVSVARAAVSVDVPTSAMPELEAEIRELSIHWRAAPPARIIVWGSHGFFREYPAWLLREFNVASLFTPSQIAALDDAQPVVLLLAGADGWRYDRASGRLSISGDFATSARLIYRGRWASAFTLQPGGDP